MKFCRVDPSSTVFACTHTQFCQLFFCNLPIIIIIIIIIILFEGLGLLNTHGHWIGLILGNDVWSDGSPVDYQNYGPGSGGMTFMSNCLFLWGPNNFYFMDADCSDIMAYICSTVKKY